jgi:hypothetical protein
MFTGIFSFLEVHGLCHHSLTQQTHLQQTVLWNLKKSVNRKLHEELHNFYFVCNTGERAVPWLRGLVAGFSPRRPWFDPGSVHVGFVVNKVVLEQDFPRVLWFSPVNFIPPLLYYKEKRKKKN